MGDLDRIERERDVEQLRRMALVLAQENQRLVTRVLELQRRLLAAEGKEAEQLELELAKLERELADAGKRLGRNVSEKRPRQKPDPDKQREAQTGHGPRPQPELEVQQTLWELDEADKVCSVCGEQLDEWPDQFEESEEVDVIEREFVIRRHRRKKYRCRCGGCVQTAPGPKRLLPGGRYSTDFAIEVAVDKYVDHQPLERQVREMGRQGLEVDSQTLFDQLWPLTRALAPAYERLGIEQRKQSVLFVDETGWPLFAGKGQAAHSSRWKIWTLTSPIGIYDDILDGRSTACASALLSEYEGTVMCDGYVVYESLQKAYPKLRLVHCWAHVRRKFVECEAAAPVESKQVIDLIAAMYAIEARVRDGPAEDRIRVRQEESKPIVGEIHSWVLATRPLPGGPLDKAIRYMAKRWSRLTRFLDDPAVPLDNNAAERALRSPVLGRKNHYGSRSQRGVRVAATLYSLLGSAVLLKLDPKHYLRVAVAAALDGRPIPLPHELMAAT